MVISELLPFRATTESLKSLAVKDNIPAADYPLWVSEKLHFRRPRLSPLFDAQVAQIVDVDDVIGAHLVLFKNIHTSLEEHLGRFIQDIHSLRGGSLAPRNQQAMAADATAVADGLSLLSEHATCGTHFISEFILSRTPKIFKKLRMLIWKQDIEKRSKSLLKNGK
jgi:hypothetical protein